MLQGVLNLMRISAKPIAAFALMLIIFFGPTSAYALETDLAATEGTVQNEGSSSSQDPSEANEQNDQERTQESNGTNEGSFEQDGSFEANGTQVPGELEDQNDPGTPAISDPSLDGAAQEEDDLSYSATTQPSAASTDDEEGLGEQNETALSLQSNDPQKESRASVEGTTAVYRLYNPNSGEHFYTSNKDERNYLSVIGWSYEGVGWMASGSGNAVYRLYNPNAGDHHYTMSASERDFLIRAGWRYEGVAFNALDNSSKDALPVYRQYNPNAVSGAHHFTLSKAENDHIVSVGWRAEGIGWYSYSVPADFKDDFDTWGPNISGDKTLDRRIFVLEQTYTTLASCFDYVKGYRYINGTKYWSGPRVLSDDLTITLAKNMVNNNGGNCYQYASLFNWLARGLGYDSRVISGWVQSQSGGRAPHGWVEIRKDNQTYICDPDMAHALPGYTWYMVTYAKAPIAYYDW